MGLLNNLSKYMFFKNVALRDDFGLSIKAWFDEIADRIKERGGTLNLAYICAEFGVDAKIPLYGGGLGILAGCTSHSFAYFIRELQKRGVIVNIFGIGLLYSHGYLAQYFDEGRVQLPFHERWNPINTPNLSDTGMKVEIPFKDGTIKAKVWKYETQGLTGGVFPIYLLDTNLPENPPEERGITARLYDAANHGIELKQCNVLGFGANDLLKQLRLLNGEQPLTIHANEGHCAPLAGAMIADFGGVEQVRERGITFVHQNHTIVPAGMKTFSDGLVRQFIDEETYPDIVKILLEYGRDEHEPSNINFPGILLRVAEETEGITFGVARLHGRIIRDTIFTPQRFPDIFTSSPSLADKLSHVTNGVNHRDFTSERIARVFDERIDGWRENVFRLEGLMRIINDAELRGALWEAHMADQRDFFDYFNFVTHYMPELVPGVFTLGFGRRAAGYKRAMLILQNRRRLIEVAQKIGGLQLVYAGLAHPADVPARNMLRDLRLSLDDLNRASNGVVKGVFVENWKKDLAQFLVPAMDGWLNTPRIGLEASGTSWMKGFYNMVMLLSILDGAVPEVARGTIYPIQTEAPVDRDLGNMYWGPDSESLYDTIKKAGLAFRDQREQWITMLIKSTALNGPYFSSDRMVGQYLRDIYLRRP